MALLSRDILIGIFENAYYNVIVNGLQRPGSAKYAGEEPRIGLTTANIIDAIITKQINNENSTENASKAASVTSASHQHTSVIVPPKKQRFVFAFVT